MITWLWNEGWGDEEEEEEGERPFLTELPSNVMACHRRRQTASSSTLQSTEVLGWRVFFLILYWAAVQSQKEFATVYFQCSLKEKHTMFANPFKCLEKRKALMLQRAQCL